MISRRVWWTVTIGLVVTANLLANAGDSLHLPRPWGYFLGGALGGALCIAIVCWARVVEALIAWARRDRG